MRTRYERSSAASECMGAWEDLDLSKRKSIVGLKLIQESPAKVENKADRARQDDFFFHTFVKLCKFSSGFCLRNCIITEIGCVMKNGSTTSIVNEIEKNLRTYPLWARKRSTSWTKMKQCLPKAATWSIPLDTGESRYKSKGLFGNDAERSTMLHYASASAIYKLHANFTTCSHLPVQPYKRTLFLLSPSWLFLFQVIFYKWNPSHRLL